MHVKHSECHSNNYRNQKFKHIISLVIQDMWKIVSMLQFWEHIIFGILLIWFFFNTAWIETGVDYIEEAQ